MAECYIGEIRAFAFNLIPRSWLRCEGQTLNIASYNSLFALIGITFGGNGTDNFKLPDLRGMTILGDQLQPRNTRLGAPYVQLTVNNMPTHNHAISNPPPTPSAKGTLQCSPDTTGGNVTTPVGGTLAKNGRGLTSPGYGTANPDTLMKDGSISVAGTTEMAGTEQHPNMQPSLVIAYCIATQGVWPSRN
jgi:microcystin-dependent protein